jgi:hypothetical protein
MFIDFSTRKGPSASLPGLDEDTLSSILLDKVYLFPVLVEKDPAKDRHSLFIP